jgi:hypothetical protein
VKYPRLVVSNYSLKSVISRLTDGKGKQMKHITVFFLALLTLLLSVTCSVSPAVSTASNYINPAYFTKIYFGAYSHWLQPWRGYLETMPATTFLDGVGINFDTGPAKPDLMAQMLAKNGFRRARVEIGWSNITFEDETIDPRSAANLKTQLQALKKYNIRPLILINAHHGVPGPLKFFDLTITANARKGDTKVELNDVSQLKIGYSGISHLTEYRAAEALITEINGKTVTLSKPLPKDIASGTSVKMATLKYRPFSDPKTKEYRETMDGWKKYVGVVAKFVGESLGTHNSSDKGFDVEIWNELSFGSYFLYINSYYGNKPYKYHEDSVWQNIVRETVGLAEANPKDFQGVQFSDGFANTVPWPASSRQPARVAAISKHPYPVRKNYPQDEDKGTLINALMQEDKSGFKPKYSVLFPEHGATALQTETLIRDMAPIDNDIYDYKHGRNARVINGKVLPTPIWITEVNLAPGEFDKKISPVRALAIKAKTTARYLAFYLNKGATQLYFFAAAGGDTKLGMVQDNFIKYAEKAIAYPSDDKSYTSPSLAVTQRMVAKMGQEVDRNLKNTRPLEVLSISDTHNHYQYQGNNTPAQPNLYNRDVFAFLPYQVNAKRFVIPYYVMTRDVIKDLPPEEYTIKIKGIKSNGVKITAYDPINDKPVVVSSQGDDRSQDTVSLKLTATDYPYLLIVQES